MKRIFITSIMFLTAVLGYCGIDYRNPIVDAINPSFTTLTVSGQSTLGKTVIGAYDFNLGVVGSSFTFHTPNTGNSLNIEGSSMSNLYLSRTSGWDNFIRSNAANLELGLSKDEFVTFPVQMRFNYAPSIQFMPSWTDAVMTTMTATQMTFPTGYIVKVSTVIATEYIDLSPCFQGDALTALKEIKPLVGTVNADGWAEVDHATLPLGLKATITKEQYRSKSDSKVSSELPAGANANDYVKETVPTGEGRNIGRQLQLQQQAIIQLLARIEALEGK